MSESSGVQDWRAVACLNPNGERLLCVGGSSAQVRAAYTNAWGEVIRDEDRPTVRTISLQRWAGLAWAGQWEHQSFLAVPSTRGGKPGSEAAEGAVAEADPDAEIEIDADAEVDVETDIEPEIDAESEKQAEAEA